jgi:hypothetical protein
MIIGLEFCLESITQWGFDADPSQRILAQAAARIIGVIAIGDGAGPCGAGRGVGGDGAGVAIVGADVGQFDGLGIIVGEIVPL